MPGAGQVILGQQRSVAYIALEAFIWVEYFKDRQDEHKQGVGYRDLAARVARSAFSSSAPVGTWSYYELLKHKLQRGSLIHGDETKAVVIAWRRGEREDDLHAIAAPVWGSRAELAAIIGVQGPASRFDQAEMDAAVEPLLEYAREVSLELGWSGLVEEAVER